MGIDSFTQKSVSLHCVCSIRPPPHVPLTLPPPLTLSPPPPSLSLFLKIFRLSFGLSSSCRHVRFGGSGQRKKWGLLFFEFSVHYPLVRLSQFLLFLGCMYLFSSHHDCDTVSIKV